MRKEKKLRRIIYSIIIAVLIVAIGGSIYGYHHVDAKNQIHIHKIFRSKHAKHKKKVQIQPIDIGSNIQILQEQIKSITKNQTNANNKKQYAKARLYGNQLNNLRAELNRLKKVDVYLAHSAVIKNQCGWLAKNGLATYDKMINKNKMYRNGFNDGASVNSLDSEVHSRNSRNSDYQEGWIVGYASKITKSTKYPNYGTYYKAIEAYDHGTMYARHNHIGNAYLEIANVWGRYDI